MPLNLKKMPPFFTSTSEISRLIARLEKEFAKLDNIIGALLGTRKASLTDPTAKARQQGVPYDSNALTRVDVLRAALGRYDQTGKIMQSRC